MRSQNLAFLEFTSSSNQKGISQEDKKSSRTTIQSTCMRKNSIALSEIPCHHAALPSHLGSCVHNTGKANLTLQTLNKPSIACVLMQINTYDGALSKLQVRTLEVLLYCSCYD